MSAPTNDPGSTIPRRQLGRMLRQLREEAGITVGQAAAALEWSSPRIWRVEKGAVPMRAFDVQNMCEVYGAPAELTEALTTLAKETRAKGWWQAYGEVVPDWFDLYVGLETAASTIRVYEPERVHGLLQTAAYATEIYRVEQPDQTDEELQRSVEVRMQRQKILTRPVAAPKLRAVLGEAGLRRPLHDPQAMVAQLQHLLEVSKRKNVSIRVLPLRAGLHRALTTGAFHILDFPSGPGGRTPEPTTVYNDNLTGALYLDKPNEVRAYAEVWESIVALSFKRGRLAEVHPRADQEVTGMIDLAGAVWRKSSRSGGNGGSCVEVATNLAWRKSSRSGDNGGSCVEVVADQACGVVAIRDSKDPHGPVLAVPPESWRAFLATLPH